MGDAVLRWAELARENERGAVTSAHLAGELQRHGYRADPAVVLTLASQAALKAGEITVDVFREWWMHAPHEDVLLAKLAIEKLATATPKFAIAAGRRVMSDVGPLPLPSARETCDNGPRMGGPGCGDLPDCEDPEALWLSMAAWAMMEAVQLKAKSVGEAVNVGMAALAGLEPEVVVRAHVAAWADGDAELTAAFVNMTEQLWASWERDDALRHVTAASCDAMLSTMALVFPALRRQKTKVAYPALFWLRVAAGLAGIPSVERRKQLLDVFAIMAWRDNVDQTAVIQHPAMPRMVCRALVDLPGMKSNSKMWLAIPLHQMSSFARYDFACAADEAPIPLLYERAVVCLLGTGYDAPPGGRRGRVALESTVATTALTLIERVAAAYPDRDLLECVFWRLTDTFVAMQTDDVQVNQMLRHQLGRVIGTSGHRDVVWKLWSLCTDAEYAAWRWVLGAPPEAKPADEAPHHVDSISSNKVLRLVRTSVDDRSDGMGVEALLRHIAANGMVDPFTKAELTWQAIAEANPAWALWA